MSCHQNGSRLCRFVDSFLIRDHIESGVLIIEVMEGVSVCARIAQTLLAILFVYLAIVVAAFVYLVWWQALCVSFGTILVFIMALRLVATIYLQRFFRDRAGGIQDVMEQHSTVLRDATVETHSVQAMAPPAPQQSERKPLHLPQQNFPIDAEDAARSEATRASHDTPISDLNWYRMDVTIFPQNLAHPLPWNLAQLTLVPADTAEPELLPLDIPGVYSRTDQEIAIEPYQIQLIEQGEAMEPEESERFGAQRLQIIAGFPKTYRDVKFRYYLTQFGHISLPQRYSR